MAAERQDYLATIQSEHRDIMQAIRTQAVPKARAAMRKHLLNSRKRYRRLAAELGEK
jgi:DNA-binding FadR family transcriptional regulator